MRSTSRPTARLALVLLAACHAAPAPTPPLAPTAVEAPPAPAPTPLAKPPAVRILAADTPLTTARGARFTAPAQWRVSVRGAATILDTPEPGARVAFVEVDAADADAAVAAAWAAFDPAMRRTVIVHNELADKSGWTQLRYYAYETAPAEHREVAAVAGRAADGWAVRLVDADSAVSEKRGAQFDLLLSSLVPAGYQSETFVGRAAQTLDAKRLAELTAFLERARKELAIPGVSFGVIQGGKVVYAGGVGVRDLGKPAKVDADTLYMIASNTKALTTLMLAKLVDAGKLTWESPVAALLPGFKLGSDDITRQLQVKHLICACTGLPRQDYEWLFEFATSTPASSLAQLATIQPTSKFGEMFQYSNSLAAAAGYVGGHVAHPKLELGAAYDKAMQEQVFGPLGMSSTTFDFARALRANHAGAYGIDLRGEAAPAVFDIDRAAIPIRPAGGAWSNVRDMLKYVQMELASGALPNGKRYIAEALLLARRAAQVPVDEHATYGMGLEVDTTYGVPVVHHGGNLIGYHGDMIWLPEHGVGAVMFNNGDGGRELRHLFRRKLLELVFDGKPEADAELTALGASIRAAVEASAKVLTVPAGDTDALAPRYKNAALGALAVIERGPVTVFDFGEWKTEVASRKYPDGALSFVTITPGVDGFELAAGKDGDKRTLTVRDGQHAYVFVEE